MNSLQLISEFLSDHQDSVVEELQSYRIDYLKAWLCEPRLNGETLSRQEVYKISNVNLALDILISVGIGRPNEQQSTVFCKCNYEI